MDGESLDVIQEISRADGMYRIDPDGYFEAGRLALRSVHLTMLAAGIEEVNRILDFASGAGRVLRTLKAAFPEASLTACDIREKCIEFCAEVLGATPVKSTERPADVQLPGPFDLIWCGSFLSHTDEHDFLDMLRFFESNLHPNGMLVFTTLGRSVLATLRSGQNMLLLSPEEARQVVEDYERTGFGFAYGKRHEIDARLGWALASPTWVCGQLEQTPSLRLMVYREASWLGQDVIGCVKRGTSGGRA
jgi:2-polyprenyl-3-methyl-5-hydroxy-6-metoxy-1,4-benzoquinol methylase